MNRLFIRRVALLSLGLCTAMDAVSAPAVTVTSMGGSTTFVTGGSGTANFSVTLDSDVRPQNTPLQFYFMDKNGGSYASQVTNGSSACTGIPTVCSNPISLSAGGQCCLQLALDGSQLSPKTYILKAFVGTRPDVPNSVYNGQASDLPITVTSQPLTTTLTISKTTLALSVNNTTLNAGLTGNPRVLTITNTGSQTATGLTISYPTWPGGTPATTASSTCGATLAPGAPCTITITPGQNPTAGAGNAACSTGIAPTPGVINVSADNAIAVQSGVVVLSYGCIYQGGFVYSVNDSYTDAPIGGSIGGKVAALTDNVPGQTSFVNTTPNWGGYGCDIGASLWDNNSQGANDGSANSAAIVSALTTNYSASPCSLSSPVALSNYAAGICSQYTTSSDAGLIWYLPSICELSGASPSSNCATGTTSMLNQLWLLNPAVGSFVSTGDYWSSTEVADPDFAPDIAWYQQFSAGGNQGYGIKYYLLGVRCSRALTI